MARVAVIVDDSFEDSELRVPCEQLRKAGHQVVIVGREAGLELTGKKGHEKARTDLSVREATADDFDALVIPGGYSPDRLRLDEKMVGFTLDFFLQGKTVAAICHAGSMLIEADVADGRTVTSWPSIKRDLINAGAHWVDREVVEDGNLITSRKIGDLAAFCTALLRQLDGTIPERVQLPLAPEGTAAQRTSHPIVH
jgi:protease I